VKDSASTLCVLDWTFSIWIIVMERYEICTEDSSEAGKLQKLYTRAMKTYLSSVDVSVILCC